MKSCIVSMLEFARLYYTNIYWFGDSSPKKEGSAVKRSNVNNIYYIYIYDVHIGTFVNILCQPMSHFC